MNVTQEQTTATLERLVLILMDLLLVPVMVDTVEMVHHVLVCTSVYVSLHQRSCLRCLLFHLQICTCGNVRNESSRSQSLVIITIFCVSCTRLTRLVSKTTQQTSFYTHTRDKLQVLTNAGT